MAKFTFYSIVGLFTFFAIAVVQVVPSNRIVGGINAAEGQFPFQVSLMKYGTHDCGGSIISRNYVLTAAHCVSILYNGAVHYFNIRALSIRAGSINRLSGGVILSVTGVKVHERYGEGQFLNDLALLRLASPLLFSRNIQPIALSRSETPRGSLIAISGWGRLRSNSFSPAILQWNLISSISKNECYQRIGYFSDSLMCLAHAWYNGACYGDSGGPAVDSNGELVGVASFVYNGCGSNQPDGYTKVSYHSNWIRLNTDLGYYNRF